MIKEELKKFPPGCIGGEFKSRKENSNTVIFYFEENKWISRKSLVFILKRRGITFKEWQDYHYLLRDGNGDIIYPKCKYCGEIAEYDLKNIRYKCYCELHRDLYISENNSKAAKIGIEKLGSDRTSLYSFILRYGKEIGTIKYNEYRSRLSTSRTLEGMINIYGENEGRIKYSSMINNMSYSRTLEGLISKYGEIKGKSTYLERCNKISESKTLKGKIGKYGKELGEIKYKEQNENMSRSLSQYIKLYGYEEGVKRRDNFIKRYIESRKPSYSKISKSIFDIIFSLLDIEEYDVFYGSNEKTIFNTDKYGDTEKSCRKPDFLIESQKIILEFQGDYWHPRPKDFLDLDELMDDRIFESSRNDLVKLRVFRNMGYKVFYIHEYEYKENPEEVVKDCIKFITNEEFRNEYTRLIDEVLV